ncbi:interleukin-10 receptor subunit alpha [Trichomycterus rosablanca]|uniref:interleukin-10 receptor subunit alpha n=1 Tax=Trichomycterus rosablanca TaxID=2290929 RepID=UPI002F355375
MARNLWVSCVFMVLHLIINISGEVIPGNVTVHIWEGNVTVTWDPPQKNPGGCLYQVQMSTSESPSVWVNVSQCSLLTSTICNVGYLSSDLKFKVRVGIPVTQNNISWSTTKYNNMRKSQLFAPTFELSSTSYSVQVKIHRKQMLENVFPYGVQYTSYVWPDGQENKTMIKSDDDMDDNGEINFNALQSLQVYCVRIKVESTSTFATNISPVHCIKLPLDLTLVFGMILLGLLSIVAPVMLFVCFMKRPREMPTALKPVASGWRPMTIGPVQVETVNNKGWILIADTATKMQTSDKITEYSEEDNERRESLDSGVSMDHLNLSESGSDTIIHEPVPDISVDSGCGSLKLTEGCQSGTGDAGAQYSPQNTHRRGRHEGGEEDSGLGMGHQFQISDSLEGEEGGLLSEVVVGDGYRSQSPSSVDETTPNETTQLCGIETNIAFPSCGYRSGGQVTCMCSDHEYCIWCKSKKPSIEDSPQTQESHSSVPIYLKKGHVQTETFCNVKNEHEQSVFVWENVNYTDSCQFLLSCRPLLQNEKPQSCLLNTQPFTLDDVELTFS